MVNRIVEPFANTDLGKRPIDWSPNPIAKLVKEFRGGAPLAPTDFKKMGFLILPKGGVLRGGKLFIEKEKQQYCSNVYAEIHKNNIVDKEFTIVVLRDLVPSGPNIGLMVRINSDEKYLLAQGVYGLKLDDEFVSADFLIHISNTEEYRKVMRNIMVGSTQVHITNKTFLKVEIPLPPTKTEQTLIATALNDADNLISELEKLIVKKKLIKQGAMQEYFKPKKEWEVNKLGKIIRSVQLGGNYANSEINTAYPLIKMGNIQRGFISLNKIEYITENQIPDKKDKLKYGDVLFNTRNTLELVGKVCVWRDELPEAYFNSNIMRLEFNSGIISSNFFMNYLLNTRYAISSLKDIATGTTSVAAIYSRDLVNIEFPIPSKEEQFVIAQILSDMDSEIESLEKKLDKYKMIKQGMMQNLLTGKIRLV